MRTYSIYITLFLFYFLPDQQVYSSTSFSTVSPNGRIRFEFSLGAEDQLESVPVYRVMFDGQEIVRDSRLGVNLENADRLGGSCELILVDSKSVWENYAQVTGKRREITNHATQLTIQLQEKRKPQRKWELEMRAYNDGVAFRYRFLKQDGWDELAISGEMTAFNFSEDAKVFALPLNSFTSSYETRYK
ncbi:glycoside hydrolase family 97 N-terminal domain-containing protein, partial [bacterium]|nr:glycoside hydrolase family 97 N-terminal domain-containing protein [bacterium]